MLRGLFLFRLLVLPVVAIRAESKQSLTGDWIGIIDFGEQPVPFRVHFDSNDRNLINLPFEEIVNKPIGKTTITNENLHFEFDQDKTSFIFDGSLKANSISGRVASNEKKGSFELVRTLNVEVKRYFGTYELGPGKYFYIRTWDELGDNQLTYFDDEGHVGPLFAKSETEFFSGPSIWIPLPATKTFTFAKNDSGAVDGLLWQQGSEPARRLKRVDLSKEEEVKFQNGKIQLSGSLTIPGGTGRFPALVLVHGSGPVTRDFFGPIAYVFARHGIAVLSYDKRGMGGSQGHWMDMGFEDYVADALAGIHYLLQRKEIRSDAIGLWGISQAGWIVPQAAVRDSNVAFVMLNSTPAVTPAEQEIQRMSEEMKVAGSTQQEITEAVNQYNSQIQGLRPEEARKELELQMQKLHDEGKTELLSTRGLANPRYLLFYRRILDYSPVPSLQKLKCPVLVLYGELDRGVPVKENKSIIEHALQKAGNHNYTIRILPKGNHALMLSETGSMREFPYLHQFVPGLFETMVQWIHSITR
jgi:uncharacterized protein